MTAVLGIDAAWSETQPSGVALLEQAPDGWRCLAVAPSYDSFLRLAEGQPVEWKGPVAGAGPDPRGLLAAASRLLGGREVSVVAADIPLARTAIRGRRVADDKLSAAYWRQGCGTYSPGVDRPGEVGARLTQGLAACGYDLATAGTPPGSPSRLLEVYPHPALLTLMDESYRLPYKVGKAGQYYPDASPSERLARILTTLSSILAALRQRISGIGLDLPGDGCCLPLSRLKRYEDAIDAVVCAWVGAEYLAERATPYGDEDAAIWVPCARPLGSPERP